MTATLSTRSSLLAGLVATGTLAMGLVSGGTAEAGGRFGGHFSGGVHVGGGGVHVSGGGGVRWGGGVHVGGGGGGWARPAPSWRPHRWSVGGSIYVGGGYYPRPYYGYGYGYGYVPSYYGSTGYYPVAPVAGPSAYAVAAPQPELPRFGVGVFAGGIDVKGQQSSSDMGLLGRFRLTEGLLVEGELGKTELANGVRVDRRMAASLVYEIGAQSSLAPFIVGGVGVNQADVGGGTWSTTQNFAEIGGGLRLSLSRSLALMVDFRAGSRQASDTSTAPLAGTARTVAPAATGTDDTYTRGRLSAVLQF
jgi:hypothetical protein